LYSEKEKSVYPPVDVEIRSPVVDIGRGFLTPTKGFEVVYDPYMSTLMYCKSSPVAVRVEEPEFRAIFVSYILLFGN